MIGTLLFGWSLARHAQKLGLSYKEAKMAFILFKLKGVDKELDRYMQSTDLFLETFEKTFKNLVE